MKDPNFPGSVDPLIGRDGSAIEIYKYGDITHAIIGCAMAVHKILGNGFQEIIYQRALEIEFGALDIPHSRECEMPIFYKGRAIGTRRVDFFIENKIMVELKAVIQLEDVHLAQALNYLEAFNTEIGLLINFGSASLQFKRLLNKKYSQEINPGQNRDCGN